MSRWLFLIFMLVGALLLSELDRALMILQIRERLGFDPFVAMHIGSLSGWLSQILVAVAVAVTIVSILSDTSE